MKKNLIVKDIPEVAFLRMQNARENDGYGDRSWAEWLAFKFAGIHLNPTQEDEIGRCTRDSLFELWCQNFATNIPDIRNGNTITDLVPENAAELDVHLISNGPAVVVGAGPSIFKYKHLEMLSKAVKNGGYTGIICSTDRMLISCLQNDIVPFITVSVDGSPIIQKMYDHPLIKKYSSQIKVVLNATTSPEAVARCKESGVKIYWFNPMYDTMQSPESFTKLEKIMTKSQKNPNGVPALSCGGNAGCAAWILAHSLLRRSPIALIGIDLGYTMDMPVEQTPYWSSFMRATENKGSLAAQGFAIIYHPFFKTEARADPVFRHYCQGWRNLALKVPPHIETVNCTGGGTLWGPPRIKCMWFDKWLEKVKSEKNNLKSDVKS